VTLFYPGDIGIGLVATRDSQEKAAVLWISVSY
jgi:hypothetical protein